MRVFISASQSGYLPGILGAMDKSSVSSMAQRVLLVLFHVLVITVPFIFTWVNEELFEFPKMLITYGLTATILGFWVMRMIAEQRLIFRRTIFDLPLAFLVISQILSTIFSIHPYTSFFGYYTRFHGGLLSTLTYISLYYAFVSNVKRSQLPGFLLSTLGAAVGVCLYAAPEHFGHSPSCYLITNGNQFDVTCWVQDVKNRVFGTFGQPNWLAAYIITLLPVSLSLAISHLIPESAKEMWPKQTPAFLKSLAYLLLVALMFAVLLFTQSKSGLAGLVGGLIVWASLIGWQLYRHQRETKWLALVQLKTLIVVGLLVGLSLVGISQIIGKPFAPDLGQLISQYLPITSQTVPAVTQIESNSPDAPVVNRLDIGGTDSGEIRRIVWDGAWHVFLRYPLFGSGLETFAYSYYQDRPLAHNLVSEWDFLYNKAHNEFLNYLATTGVVGFVAYTGLLGWFLVVAIRELSDRHRPLILADRYLVCGLVAGLVALSISNFFGFSTVMVTILMYVYFAVLVVLRQPDETVNSANQPFSTMQYLSLAGAGLSILYAWWMVSTWWSADRTFVMGKQYLQSGYTVEGLQYLQSAVNQSPQEALFYDELATSYSRVANALSEQDATTAAELADAAIKTSDQALLLNPRHLNFYKSRARIFINLSVFSPEYFQKAKETLLAAIVLSPTDAKLRYNLALVEAALGQTTEARQTLEETVIMKPNYAAAHLELARNYAASGQIEEARQKYQFMLATFNPQDEVVLKEVAELNQAATQSGQRK